MLPHTPKEKKIPKEEDIIKLLLAADPKTDERDLIIVLLHALARTDDALRLIWQDINSEKKHETWLFYNEKTKDRYMNRPKVMRSLCARAGINPYFGFHTLRHLMASLMADNPKTSTKTIPKVLGHSAYKTTEIYLHQLDGAVEKAMDDLSDKFIIKNEKICNTSNNIRSELMITSI